MTMIPFLIGIPVLFALIFPFMRESRSRGIMVYTGAGIVMLTTVIFIVQWLAGGAETLMLYPSTELVDHLMAAGDIILMCLIVYLSIKYRRILPILLSVGQTVLMLYTEFSTEVAEGPHMSVDWLTILMCIIIAFIGGFICIYTVGYMKGYHAHHTDVQDRQPFFFSMLFLFLAAMFGLVFSQNLIWMYFFWEITSVISFLMIGYTRTDEAVNNSFCALWMNLLGGLGFAAGITWMAFMEGTVQLLDVISAGAEVPLICLALAGLTKSAQLPFSTWLVGAMVAPTPSSALLHSATMVKAGVYLLIRLSPAFYGNMTGIIVSSIGGLTFIMASMMAIAQNDGKKVLAFSTISNLGLIVGCAGIGVEETVWAAVFLMIFHSVSKSMLFQSVGATENCLGSRDIEDMHGLIIRIPKLAYIMGIGIAGMYLAPFGMLISKWVALKAFVDSGNFVLVLFIAYGSATTMFYWTKWLAKLLCYHIPRDTVKDVTHRDEYVSMSFHAAVMLLLCLFLPFVAIKVVNPIVRELFGNSTDVLSMSVLATMAIMLVSIFIVPVVMFFISRRSHRELVPIYMNGINEGDNRYFTNSFGDKEHLYLSNWYLRFEFGRRHLRIPAIILAAAVLVLGFCLVIGGAL
ncbi:NADH-quinone oxidoreductase subunit L [Lachnoclostridium sp. An169]|uniref:NADH-quinone oxidoreductase subunit 5 family protein n=1 Tax=Lachnoclostridium sp. An169 TaxID=1965569 RepID=UPI000B3ACFA3|nr:proton-conducting transporter membrane subunit [Lachnoclostridium sp. An169]OUP81346.1 NADH-quinone oxidoreductase subunit L [Lachnoclostridium sp. An169]HJA66195.1 NADH-quinone oxidoreductase subunit L [Candidatus Mediterraneibacter cottocaccae]